jgi:hypothetical protein
MIERITNFIECRVSNMKLSYLRKLIATKVHSHDTVMDIGSGNRVLDLVEWKELYRVDPILKTTDGYYDTMGTWVDAIKIMTDKKIDCVFLMDVIEHLYKDDAIRLLKTTTRLTKQIVVFTPLGFFPQEDGEWNTHRSGWFVNDFGPGWNTAILEDFHTVDFKGNKLDKPISALLAIYN